MPNNINILTLGKFLLSRLELSFSFPHRLLGRWSVVNSLNMKQMKTVDNQMTNQVTTANEMSTVCLGRYCLTCVQLSWNIEIWITLDPKMPENNKYLSVALNQIKCTWYLVLCRISIILSESWHLNPHDCAGDDLVINRD